MGILSKGHKSIFPIIQHIFFNVLILQKIVLGIFYLYKVLHLTIPHLTRINFYLHSFSIEKYLPLPRRNIQRIHNQLFTINLQIPGILFTISLIQDNRFNVLEYSVMIRCQSENHSRLKCGSLNVEHAHYIVSTT